MVREPAVLPEHTMLCSQKTKLPLYISEKINTATFACFVPIKETRQQLTSYNRCALKAALHVDKQNVNACYKGCMMQSRLCGERIPPARLSHVRSACSCN